MRALLLVLALVMTGCEKEAQSTNRTSNSAVSVDLLFEHDGCKIYRFYDNGRSHYFVKCENVKLADTINSFSSDGKTTRTKSIPTVSE